MKKQIVTACALIASVAAFATSVESSNTFGVLKIDVGETTKEVVIPVPWAAVGTGDAAIKVTDFVLATGRVSGDTLYIYDASAKGYKVWQADGNGNWAPENTVLINAGDEISHLNATTADTIARGQAAILVLNAASADNKPVYLSGQYSDATATTTVYGLTADEAKFAHLGKTHSTLIAAPKAEACNLNELTYTIDQSATMEGDKIMVFNGSNYEYGAVAGQDGNKWYKIDPKSGDRTIEGVSIPLGTGAWYIRKNQGNVIINWN